VCPEIFDVDQPAEVEAESTFPDSEVTLADPSAAIELDDMEVPPEVQSSFGADADVVTDIEIDTADEFGEREISFGSDTMETDIGLTTDPDIGLTGDPDIELTGGPEVELDTEPDVQVETTDEDFSEVEVGDPAVELEVAVEAGETAADAAATDEQAPAEEAPSTGTIQFGKRSPEDKARSLARSLVSDLIAYNPDKHTEALASGTLLQVFGEEIDKSWKEYRDQVDPDVMTQGTFFNDALNELLADGESVFNVEG
jgi:hypothetical protein